MITYRCSVSGCRVADEHLLPVVAEALQFKCPECQGALEPEGQDAWSLDIASNAHLWPESSLELPFFAAAEIERLRELFKNGQTYGSILQLRDVLEVLLKLPLLLGASQVLSREDLNGSERDFLYSLVEKPLSLGDWHRIATVAGSSDVRLSDTIRQIISAIKRVFDQNQVAQWRNETIGHGALGFDTDANLRSDLESKLVAIAEHLQGVAGSYSLLDIRTEANGQLISLRGQRSDALDGASGDLLLAIGTERWPIFPYIHLIDGGIFFFDAYNHRKLQNTALLSYTDGHKRRERFRRLAELYEHLVLTTRLKIAGNEIDQEVRTRDQEQVFLRDWHPEDLVEPKAIENWLRKTLAEEEKGVLLLQMERGCGKTTFCHHIDDLRRTRPVMSDTAIRIYYGNELYGYIPGNFTWSVTDSFRADRQTGKTITGNIPFLSPVASDKKGALVQQLEFFLVHRRRLFGDRRLVLVIDAIDESPLQNEAPILDFIPAPENLEPGIFILITARTDGELQPAIRRQLCAMPTTRKLVIKRDEPVSLQLLETYLHKTNTPRILWNHFLAISDQRFLYLRALVGALALFGARRPDELPRGSALVEALLDKLGRIYGRHSEHLYDIVTVITFAYEALSVEEICFLISERYPSLRTAAFLRDLSGILRIDRGERGAVYTIAHEEIARALRVRFAARQEYLLRPWMDSLRDGADEVLKEPSCGLDYLLAHVDNYAASIAIVLPVAAFADRLVSYACRDGAFPAGDRRRQILLSAFRGLDRADDAEAYLAAAILVRAPILVEVLEQRLTERDSVLSRLQNSSDLSSTSNQSFFRALAVACYQTQDYTAAVSLSDRLYSVTQSTPDLINLALMLKGTDASVDGAYTMARARVIAGQLLADRHADALTGSQRGYALYTIGRIFGDTMEHLSEAVPLFEESLRAFEGAEDELGALAVRNSIALAALDSGEFGRAADAIREVVTVLQSRQGEFPSHMGQAALVNWYVLSYLAGDEIADPIEASTIQRWEVRAYHLNNRFLVEYAKGNQAAAISLADECLDLTKDHNGVYSRAAILNNTGVAFGRYADVRLAHEMCKASGYSIGEAIASCNLGLTSVAPSGVLRVAASLLWPCSKNFDMLVPVLHV